MIQEWYELKDLLGIGGLATTVQGVTKKAKNENWQRRRVTGVKGRIFEYYIGDMPPSVQQALGFSAETTPSAQPNQGDATPQHAPHLQQSIRQVIDLLEKYLEEPQPQTKPDNINEKEWQLLQHYRQSTDQGKIAIHATAQAMAQQAEQEAQKRAQQRAELQKLSQQAETQVDNNKNEHAA